MPHAHAIVLRQAASGESFLKLDLLTLHDGAFLCLKRISKKRAEQTSPDLFDTAALQLERSKQGGVCFVSDYELIKRRQNIGRSYHSLRHASEYCALLARNAPQMIDTEPLFSLAVRSLDAFAADKAPEVVHLKAIYLLLQNEGYPIRECWWRNQSSAIRAQTVKLINSPAPQLHTVSEQRTDCEKIIIGLYRWMERETDLVLPE